MFRIDSEGVTRAIMSDVTFKDNTDVLICAFVAGNFNFTQNFYDYITNDDNSGRFLWVTEPTSTYSDGITELPLVVVA